MTTNYHEINSIGLSSVLDHSSFSLDDISVHFLKSLAITEGLIMDAINRLVNSDASEVSRIIANKSKTSLKESDDKERYFVELFLCIALSECGLCAINFEDGDLLGAFNYLTLANNHLGVSSGLSPSESFNKLRSESKVLAGAIHANKKRVEIWNDTQANFKLYWQNNINPTKKATDAAILLERSSIYENSNPKPKRSSLESYVRSWQAALLGES